VDVSRRRLRRVIRLAAADDASVGVKAQPQQVRVTAELQSFDARDFHRIKILAL
jgi:hypothetical protein